VASARLDRVQQCLARLTSLTSNEAKEHTSTFYSNVSPELDLEKY